MLTSSAAQFHLCLYFPPPSPPLSDTWLFGEGERIKGLWELSPKSIKEWLFLPSDALVLGKKKVSYSVSLGEIKEGMRHVQGGGIKSEAVRKR